MNQPTKDKLKLQGLHQVEELTALLKTWDARNDNEVASMFLLLGVAIRGLRLFADKHEMPTAKLWDDLLDESHRLWNAAHEDLVQAAVFKEGAFS